MNKHWMFSCLLLFMLSGTLLPAQYEEIPEVQELNQIEEIMPEEATPSALELVGRFHPMLLHFPIAWLILLLMADLYIQLRKETSWVKPILYLHVLALLSFVPAATTGFILAAHSGTDADFLHLAAIHRNLNIGGALLCLLSLAFRIKARVALHGVSRKTSLYLVIFSTAFVLLASHYGGKIAFGENFLPF